MVFRELFLNEESESEIEDDIYLDRGSSAKKPLVEECNYVSIQPLVNASIDDSSYQEYLNNADIGVDSSIEK